jgi:hypothetical protein
VRVDMAQRKSKTPRHEQPLAASHATSQPAVDDSHESRLRRWLLGSMMALLVARPLFPSEAAATSGDGLSMVMLWIALGVFWLLGAITASKGTVPFSLARKSGQSPVGRPAFSLRFGCADAAVLLLVVWNTVAALWAVQRGTPRPAINMLWEWVGMGLCFFLARQLVVTPRERRAVAAVMIALAVAISGYGLYQCCYEMPQTRAIYKADPDQALRNAGQRFPPGSPERKLFEDRLENNEPTATFALTNSLAAFLTPWLLMLAGVIGSSVRNRKRLLAMAVCLAPIIVCFLLTESRSGYAAVCVGAVLAWWLSRQQRVRIGWKLPAVLAGIAAVLLSAALAIKGPEVLGRASKSFGYRLQYWQSSLQMIADRPWVGCGPGNFQAAYTQYKLPEASEEIADPHNFLLEIWATAGTPAALAFLAVLGCTALGVRGQGSAVSGEGRGERGEGRGAGIDSANLQVSKSPNPNPQSPIPNPLSDAWLYVLGGGAAGFLLSWPLGILSAAPPNSLPVNLLWFELMVPVPMLLGLPLAAATVALMLGWIREGRLLLWLPGVCVVSLLVNLLAAGGIALPSIAGTFWLLLAMALDGRQPRTLRTYAAWAGLAGLLALSVACYRTAYSPVLNCQAELRLAEMRLADREPLRAIEHLEAAAAADPLSSEPWCQLAAIELEVWWNKPDKADFSRFVKARDQALSLAPNSAAMWLAAGDWAIRAASKTDQRGKRVMPDAIQSAVESYSRAAQLYPNSALCRAKLAEAHLAAGDRSAFRREAEIALWLHETTPHTDKKLPDELCERLSRNLLEKKSQ